MEIPPPVMGKLVRHDKRHVGGTELLDQARGKEQAGAEEPVKGRGVHRVRHDDPGTVR